MAAPEPTPQSTPAPLLSAGAPRVFLVAPSDRKDTPRLECRRAVTLIGSRDRCKLCLRHGAVAPVHVAIVHDGTAVTAVDLVTSRGTLLNGLKMEHEALRDGDVLSIGPWDLKVEITAPETNDHPAEALDLEPTPQAFALEHVATHRILQPNRAVCIIGRRKGCDVAISDARVSRAHSILFNYLGHPAVYDLLSRNETFVNAEPVSFRLLRNDDVLAVGDSKFRVRVLTSGVGRATGNSESPILAAASVHAETSGVTFLSERSSSPPPADMIDIKSTEGSQTWHIVDHLEKATRKKQVGG